QHVRAALWWRPTGTRVRLTRSISLFGVCATDVSRELAGHRNLSTGLGAKAVSRGVSWPRFAQHVGGCQSHARLADLCRLRAGADRARSKVAVPLAAGGGLKQDGLCLRLDPHRPVHELVSLGAVSSQEGGRETAFPAG